MTTAPIEQRIVRVLHDAMENSRQRIRCCETHTPALRELEDVSDEELRALQAGAAAVADSLKTKRN